MKQYLALVLLSCSLLFACSDSETRTQLTFMVDAPSSVRSQIETLSVVIRGAEGGDLPREFDKSELAWPVEIVVLPAAGNDSSYEVTLSAIAYGAGRTKLAETRASSKFAPATLRRVPVTLGADAVGPGPDLDGGRRDSATPDSDDTDTDDDDDVVAPGEDAEVVDPGEPTPPPPPKDAGIEVVVNCETDKTITCDDDNPCNGVEKCAPKNASANGKGCVAGIARTCPSDQTCDRETGDCSACLAKPDGDNDGASSMACGGKDCNDNDPGTAPGKPELCDNQDNDCDGATDGTKAAADCKAVAPTGGSAACVAGVCVPACDKPDFQPQNGVCVAKPVSCPVINPCAPGLCAGGNGTYTCTCPAKYQTGVGMSRCAPVGVPTRKIGFEATCDDKATPGAFVAEYKPLSATQYATCGLATIGSSSMLVAPQLYQPALKVEGLTKDTALASPFAAAGPVDLALAFFPAVNEVTLTVLEVDSPTGVSVVVRAGGVDLPAQVLVPAAGSKTVPFATVSEQPIDRVTITYTPIGPMDGFAIDELGFRIAGCGDKVVDKTLGEACDDGNAVQCDGCDNACALNPTPCPGG
jgi:cysteine-rich repeat protein